MVGGFDLKAVRHGDVMPQCGHIIGVIENVVDAHTAAGSNTDGMPRAESLHADGGRQLRLGQPRPSQGRKTVYCFKFFEKDSPLLPSGLFGPVYIKCMKTIKDK